MDRNPDLLMSLFVAVSREIRRRLSSDRGAILVFVALLIVVLLGLAAVAVDLAALFVERRHVQTAADVSALAGAQSAGVNSDPLLAKQAVIAEVKALAATNLDDTDWASCSDTDKPLEFSSVAGDTDCISFTFGLSKIRVRTPDQTFDSFFAGILGFDTLTTSASAEVSITLFRNGDILPFGIPIGDANSTLGCPSDHPNGLFPCDGPDSGNFNRLQMPQWGTAPPPAQDCTHSNGMFEDNIANGIDHTLGVYDAVTNTVVDDQATCTAGDANLANPPGTVISETGVSQSTLSPGLITGNTGGNGFDGRLTDLSAAGTSTTNVFGQVVDSKPLWAYIGNYPSGGNIGGVPDSCQGPTFTGASMTDWDEDLWVEAGDDPITGDPDYTVGDPTSHLEASDSFEHMARCLREYRLGEWDDGGGPPYAVTGYNTSPGASDDPGTAVLFDKDTLGGTDPQRGVYDLQLSPRWGWSPIGSYSTGTSPFPIQDFKPIFINTLVSQCNAHTCSWVWHAGDPAPSATPPNPKIASIISFQVPASALPSRVIELRPGVVNEVEYTLTR